MTLTGTGTVVQATGTALGVDNQYVNVAFELDNLGRRLDQRSVPTTEVESRDLLRWAQRPALDRGSEHRGASGSYGAGPTRLRAVIRVGWSAVCLLRRGLQEGAWDLSCGARCLRPESGCR